jgi:hypothetical protein
MSRFANVAIDALIDSKNANNTKKMDSMNFKLLQQYMLSINNSIEINQPLLLEVLPKFFANVKEW